jgi:hypothetical protein
MTDFSLVLQNNIVNTAAELAHAFVREMALEDTRITAKMEAIDRIMSAGDNKFTGKPHSFSSAEALVNTDIIYQDYLALQREAVRARIIARGVYDAAVVAGRLAEKGARENV